MGFLFTQRTAKDSNKENPKAACINVYMACIWYMIIHIAHTVVGVLPFDTFNIALYPSPNTYAVAY